MWRIRWLGICACSSSIVLAACNATPPVSQGPPAAVPATKVEAGGTPAVPNVDDGTADYLHSLARMDNILKPLELSQQPLEKVIGRLGESWGSLIFVDWRSLEFIGVYLDTPVTLKLREMTFRKALKTVLAHVGAGAEEPAYKLEGRVIVISSRSDLTSAKSLVRVFDVRDLLQVNDGVLAEGLFSGKPETPEAKAFHAAEAEKLVQYIQANAAPGSWRNAGGAIGSIRELNGQLIVNQTIENHLAVQFQLERLRTANYLPQVKMD